MSTVATDKGAYISVLCRIHTIEESGVETQQYPRHYYDFDDSDNADVNIGNSYAWAAIPINTLWKPGYRYTYTLEFSDSAAGYIDPDGELVDGADVLTGQDGTLSPIDGKDLGDTVLGAPIKFVDITVTDFSNAETIKPLQ